MQAFSHLWQYVGKFILEWEIFKTKVVDKIKTHMLCSITFFWKSCRWWENVEKCGGAKKAVNDVTIWRICVASRISKATCARAHIHAHASWHTHTHVCTHKEIYNTYYFSMETIIRERASMLHYMYIACLVMTQSYSMILWVTQSVFKYFRLYTLSNSFDWYMAFHTLNVTCACVIIL
jgi:hypothetical protein